MLVIIYREMCLKIILFSALNCQCGGGLGGFGGLGFGGFGGGCFGGGGGGSLGGGGIAPSTSSAIAATSIFFTPLPLGMQFGKSLINQSYTQ